LIGRHAWDRLAPVGQRERACRFFGNAGIAGLKIWQQIGDHLAALEPAERAHRGALH
jgi:hypothetical protein